MTRCILLSRTCNPNVKFCNPNAHFATPIFVHLAAIQTEFGTGGLSWESWEKLGLCWKLLDLGKIPKVIGTWLSGYRPQLQRESGWIIAPNSDLHPQRYFQSFAHAGEAVARHWDGNSARSQLSSCHSQNITRNRISFEISSARGI